MQLWRAQHITIPLGKLHRHVVDVLTIYPYHSVNSTDTWYPVGNMMLVLYLVSPCPLASVCLFTVFSYRYRIIVIVTDIPKYCRYGISYRIVSKRYIRNVRYDIHHKRSYPPIFRLHSHHFLVNFAGCPCMASVQITDGNPLCYAFRRRK